MLKTRLYLCSLFLCTLTLQAQSRSSKSPPPAQTPITELAASLPSRAEIEELVSKASEKIGDFQSSLNAIKPLLDKTSTDTFKQDSDACEAASAAISAIKKNGPSAYALVGLISILDDLSLDAARASTQILMLATQDIQAGGKNQVSLEANLFRITEAGKNTYDISELLLHSTLRYIAVEEALLNSALDKTK